MQKSFSIAWNSLTFLSKNIESFLNGTPFKTPVAVFNVLVELGKVDSLLRIWQIDHFQAVADNKDATEKLIDNLTQRITDVSEAYKKARSDDASMRIDNFAQYVLYYELYLSSLFLAHLSMKL